LQPAWVIPSNDTFNLASLEATTFQISKGYSSGADVENESSCQALQVEKETLPDKMLWLMVVAERLMEGCSRHSLTIHMQIMHQAKLVAVVIASTFVQVKLRVTVT